MLEHDALKARVSLPHLLEYFTFQNIFTDGTLFADVRLLRARPPRSPCAPTVARRAWSATGTSTSASRTTDARPDAEYEEELDRLFRQAVRRQLVSDVPVGAHLSGGMDSGSITALAAEALPYLNTFTVGFDMTSRRGLEVAADERVKAEAMSYQFRTEHYEVVLKSGDMERCLPALVWHLEDPRVGQCYPNFYGARLAGKFVKVVLSGSGGDELFAGYPWRYYRAVVNDDFDDYVEKYYGFWHRLVPNTVLRELFRPAVWDEIGDLRTIDIFRDQFPDAAVPESPEDYVNHSLYLEAKTFLPGLFVVEDKLSMAHSLESRVPFLDNDLVDFAQRVPVRLKLRDLDHVVKLDENMPSPKTERYFERTRDGKLLLRRVMQRYVPESVTNQVKQGFSGPDASWFRGDSVDYVRNVVLDDDAAMYEFLDPGTVRDAGRRALERAREPPAAPVVAAHVRALVPDVPGRETAVRILVTGGTGFIGRHLIAELRERHEIVALTRSAPPRGPRRRASTGASRTCATALPRASGAHRRRRPPRPVAALQGVPGRRRGRVRGQRAEHVPAARVGAQRVGARTFVLVSTGGLYAYSDDPVDEDAAVRAGRLLLPRQVRSRAPARRLRRTAAARRPAAVLRLRRRPAADADRAARRADRRRRGDRDRRRSRAALQSDARRGHGPRLRAGAHRAAVRRRQRRGA